ncbi:MFS transporter [Nocardioides solisilvae]|uniref:MFS transporter n=1 Tax=Nocardioides solisilvae TaxID=1542435 RepID=UPI000D74D4C0|nr:MFS transporter [Nocardioides solisilvae]
MTATADASPRGTTEGSAAIFWRFWSALTLSRTGTAVSAIAIPLVAVTVLDASALELGLIAASANVAWLVLGLPAGVIVQRFPLRGGQVAMDLARAAAILSVPLAWWLAELTVAHLVVVGLVVSLCDVLFDVATWTFLPRIVDDDELQRRNSLMSGTDAVTGVAGPSLGGLLVSALGGVVALLVDVVTYVASAVLLRTLPARDSERRDEWPPVTAMIREGWRFVAGHPVMAPLTWSATALNFVCGAHLALFPVYLVRELDASGWLVGLLLATEGVGALVGAALATPLAARFGTARITVAGCLVAAAGAVLIPWGGSWVGMAVFAVGTIVFTAGTVVMSITTRTYRQLASPPDLLSRVMATVRFVSWGALPVGSVVAGLLAESVGSRATLLVLGLAAFAAPAFLVLSQVRGLRDLESGTAARDA